MADNIQIKVSVEAGGALSNIEQLKAKLGQTKENIELLKNEIKDLGTSLSRNDKEIASVNKQLTSLNTTSATGRKEAAGLRVQLAQLATTNNTLVTGIKNTKVELAAESTAMKVLANDVKAAEVGGSGFAKGLSSIFGGLRKIAYLIPGIGIAGLIGLLTGPLIDAFSSLIGKESELTKEQNKFNDSLDEAAKRGLATGAQLQAFVNIAKDGTLPLQQRNEALKEANKILGEHGEKLTLANVATAAITKQTELFTQALINESIAAKYADRIADLRIQQTEATKKYTAAVKEAVVAEQQSLKTGSLGSGGIGGSGLNVTTATQSARALNIAKNAAKDYREISDQLITTTNDLFQTELKATAGFAELGTKAKETSGKVETIADVLAKLGREIDFLNSKELELGTNETKAKITAIENAIQHLIRDLKVPCGSTVIEKLFGDIRELLPGLLKKVNAADIRIKTSFEVKEGLEKARKEAEKELGTNPLIKPVKIPIEVTADPFAKTRKQMEDFQNFATEVFSKAVVGAFVKLGESIGAALSGGTDPIGSFFGGIASILASSLKTLGQYVIESSTLIAAIKKALNKAFAGNPALGIGVGIALIAIGSALENSIPKFAGGVQNFSGGIALVGERGPELVNLPRGSDVIPNHRIGNLSGSGVQVFIPDTRISGADIVISYTRQQQRNNRNS